MPSMNLRIAGEVAERLRPVKRVQIEIGLCELVLTQLGAKDIDWIVSAGYVLGNAKLRQQSGARHRGIRLCFLVAGARNRSFGVFTQSLIDGLPERQRILCKCGQSPKTDQERKTQGSMETRSHCVVFPRVEPSYE